MHHRIYIYIYGPGQPSMYTVQVGIYFVSYVMDTSIYVSRVSQNRIYTYVFTVYRICGDYKAKNTVCTPCIYGSGQPYT